MKKSIVLLLCASLFVIMRIKAMNSPQQNHKLLTEAVRAGNCKKIKQLKRSGADVNHPDQVGNTFLHRAIINKNNKTLKALISSYADVNIQNNNGQTPLHLAVKIGNVEAVDMLIKAGARTDLVDTYSNTPVQLSRSSKVTLADRTRAVTEIQKVLEGESFDEQLLGAATSGNLDTVTKLLNTGAKPSTTNKHAQTALHLAAQQGHVEIVKTLIQANGHMVHAMDAYGSTPLHLAALAGKTEIIQQLIDAGARINVTDGTGSTPLHSAVFSGNKDTINILIEHGADKHATDNDGNTPLSLAREFNRTEIVELLNNGTTKVRSSPSLPNKL